MGAWEHVNMDKVGGLMYAAFCAHLSMVADYEC